jgi:hypothetical protein
MIKKIVWGKKILVRTQNSPICAKRIVALFLKAAIFSVENWSKSPKIVS